MTAAGESQDRSRYVRGSAGLHDGRSWGDGELCLYFAGRAYQVRGLSPRQVENVRQRYGVLCAPTEPAGSTWTEVSVQRTPADCFHDVDFRGGIYNLEMDYTPNHVRVRGLRFAAELTLGTPLVVTLCTPDDGDAQFESSFENLFRVLVAYGLLHEGGVLLHSAGVLVEGQAYVLFGPSGAGKTTASGLSHDAGLQVLSDELNGLRLTPNGVQVIQLPFAGDFGSLPPSIACHPLGGVFRLYQAPVASVAPMPRASALSSLFAAAPFVNVDPFRGPRLLDNLIQLTAELPLRALHFSLSPSFWKEVMSS